MDEYIYLLGYETQTVAKDRVDLCIGWLKIKMHHVLRWLKLINDRSLSVVCAVFTLHDDVKPLPVI